MIISLPSVQSHPAANDDCLMARLSRFGGSLWRNGSAVGLSFESSNHRSNFISHLRSNEETGCARATRAGDGTLPRKQLRCFWSCPKTDEKTTERVTLAHCPLCVALHHSSWGGGQQNVGEGGVDRFVVIRSGNC